jgi:hypothetical protein
MNATLSCLLQVVGDGLSAHAYCGSPGFCFEIALSDLLQIIRHSVGTSLFLANSPHWHRCFLRNQKALKLYSSPRDTAVFPTLSPYNLNIVSSSSASKNNTAVQSIQYVLQYNITSSPLVLREYDTQIHVLKVLIYGSSKEAVSYILTEVADLQMCYLFYHSDTCSLLEGRNSDIVYRLHQVGCIRLFRLASVGCC